jgi:hypothetical protein
MTAGPPARSAAAQPACRRRPGPGGHTATGRSGPAGSATSRAGPVETATGRPGATGSRSDPSDRLSVGGRGEPPRRRRRRYTVAVRPGRAAVGETRAAAG